MALNSLSELVNLTGNAVKSLNKSNSSGSSEKAARVIDFNSPFESPRSFSSAVSSLKLLSSVNNVVTNDSGINTGATPAPEVESKERQNENMGEEISHDESTDKQITEIVPDIACAREEETNGDRRNQNLGSGQEFDMNGPSVEGLKVRTVSKSINVIIEKGDSYKTLGQERDRFGKQFQGVNINQNNTKSNGFRGIGIQEDVFDDRSSYSSDQPEIIDVHENIVLMTSGLSGTSEEDSNAISKVTQANEPRGSVEEFFGKKSFGKTANGQVNTLKQGALSKGTMDPTQTTLSHDVYISQFGLSEKQRGLKEALAKRSENNKPKKKFVQPQVIRAKSANEAELDSDGVSDKGSVQSANPGHTGADPAVTAAVAASAAVAVTQPFIKAQQELETRMQQLLDQLSKAEGSPSRDQKSRDNKLNELEQQVKELNERRLEHLEKLQQQQLQMQAQLLMMSRSRSPNHRAAALQYKRQQSPNRQFQTSRIPQAISKQISNTAVPAKPSQQNPLYEPPLFPYNNSINAYHSQQPTFNPELIQKHHNYLNEVRELQGSHLDTPAPREKVPKPTPYSLPQDPQRNLGFLQELLAHKDPDTTFSVKGGYSPTSKLERDMNNSARGRRGDKSPVDKARQLVSSLSTLERETAESLLNPKDDVGYLWKHDLGPAPLEHYLKYPESDASPYPKLSDPSKSPHRSRRAKHTSQHLALAKDMLQKLEMTRGTLEKNLEQVVRSRQDMQVFSTLLASAPDGASEEQQKIERMVNKKIMALQNDIQRGVLHGLAQQEAERRAAEEEMARRKLQAKKADSGSYANTRSSTLRQQAERSARLAYSKVPMPAPSKALVPGPSVLNKGKENRTTKVKPVPKPSAIKDEKTMTRTYGKPDYQRGRTTIRDPYMHFKNPKKGVTGKSAMNESMVSSDGRTRSPARSPVRGQAGYVQGSTSATRQFYFSPTRGYIPMGSTDTAPVQGQLVSMAIPLGEPRMEPGVRQSATLPPRTSNPVTSTPVTAARNVAVVSFPMEEEVIEERREPELAKQVLPPIDIDSISPSSSRRSDIHIRSPQHGNPNVTFLQDVHDDDADIDLDETLTEERSDLEQSGQGILLPGYEPKASEHFGPSFPPQTTKPGPGWMAGEAASASKVSDVMAEDLRRRDVLEMNAVQWLEQELMAKVISEVMPLQLPEPAVPEVAREQSMVSEQEDRADSLLVADMLGQGGLQLFIDAGQPVDNALVSALVKEVLQERINNMLAERPSRDPTDGQDIGGRETKHEEDEGLERRQPTQKGPAIVPTPELTPMTSPLGSPRRTIAHHTQPTTPPLSPPSTKLIFRPSPESEPPRQEVVSVVPVAPQAPPEPVPVVAAPVAQTAAVESESEISESIDISVELKRIAAQGKKAPEMVTQHSVHDVTTPPISPTSVMEKSFLPTDQKQVTPPMSPEPVVEQHVFEMASVSARQPLPSAPKAAASPPEQEEEEEESEEEDEDEELNQPEPIMMSIAIGTDRPMSPEKKSVSIEARSPVHSPPKRASPPQSLSPPPSTESSYTETVNDNISEGQWLLSRSEGQIAGIPLTDAARQEYLRKRFQNMGDVSTASTLRDTEDIDLNEFDGTRSEGEFLHAGLPAPENDPMLGLLAQMQRNPLMIPQRDLPQDYVNQMLSAQEGLNATGKSMGEMSVGQVPNSRLVMVQARANGKKRGQRSPQTRSPTRTIERVLEDDPRMYDDRRERRREGRREHSRSPSPSLQVKQSGRQTPPGLDRRTRSPQGQERTRSPQGPERRTRSPQSYEQRTRSPQGSERTRSPQGQTGRTRSPQGQQLRSRTPPQQSPQRGRPRSQMPYQPVLSEGGPSRGRTPPGHMGRRSGDSRISRSSEQVGYSGYSSYRESESYRSENLTRSADSPSLRRSGEGGLTSSFKSRQSGVKKSVEFDLTGTHEGRESYRSSVRQSRDSYQSSGRLSSSNRSLGLPYSFDESLDESELKRIGTGESIPYQMSVTLPSTGENGESDLSEIDITEN